MNKLNSKIHQYHFEDSKERIKVLIIFNLILAIIFLFESISSAALNLRCLICFSVAIIFSLLFKFYNWKSFKFNMASLCFYLLLFFVELFLVGYPEGFTSVAPNTSARGWIFQLVLSLTPLMYLCTRLFMAFPLVSISYNIYKADNKNEDDLILDDMEF